MGKNQKLKEVVRVTRINNDPHGLPVPVEIERKVGRFLVGLRMRTLHRTMARATGMETKYTEQHTGKTWGGLSRGYRRALDRAEKNSPEAVERVQKTYPGARVSSGLTRTCVYE